MNTLIVIAHHEPASFNHAMGKAAQEQLTADGHDVVMRDLFAEGFNPVPSRADFATVANPDRFIYQGEQSHASERSALAGDIASYLDLLRWCELLVLQFPIWWFSVPAILKGWFDRVLVSGAVYGGGRWFETAPLYGRRAIISATSGAGWDRWSDQGLFGDIERVLHPLRVGTLNFCGFEVLRHQIVAGPRRMSEQERASAIVNWRSRLSRIENEIPLPFRRASDFANAAYRSDLDNAGA